MTNIEKLKSLGILKKLQNWINTRPPSFWVGAVIRCFLKAIQLVVIFLIFKVFDGGWLMFWLLLSLISVSYADGYWKGINKK
jgi:hypothetical protein